MRTTLSVGPDRTADMRGYVLSDTGISVAVYADDEVVAIWKSNGSIGSLVAVLSREQARDLAALLKEAP